MDDDGRCSVGLWESSGDPNPHIMKVTQRCGERAGHAGRIHKHGGYVWLDDGSQDKASSHGAAGHCFAGTCRCGWTT